MKPRAACPDAVAALVALTMLGSASCSGDGESGALTPTGAVVVITCDTLRADSLGFYGAPRETSPALDRFAAEAVVFDNAWSAAPMTLPALSSLFTKRTSDELGVSLSNQFLLAAEIETLPEVLSGVGVETAAIVSNAVLRRYSPSIEVGISQGFAHYDDRMGERELHRSTFERSAPETTRAALEWLDGRADAERPFFLWVHYIEPHGPYTSGDPAAAGAVPVQGGGSERELPFGTTDSGLGQIPRYQVLPGLARPSEYRVRYEAEIRYVDAAIGGLLDGLRERGLYDEATLVFSADHGESLGEHDYWFSHGETVYQELVRVPLAIRAPGAERGTRRSELVSHLQLFDTVLAAFGLPDSNSSLLHSGARPVELAVHARGRPQTPRYQAGATDGRYHLVLRGDGTRELYDLRDDPYEERDLAADEPERLETLHALYRDFLAARPSDLPPAVHVRDLRERPDRARREADLRALGYGGGEADEADGADGADEDGENE